MEIIQTRWSEQDLAQIKQILYKFKNNNLFNSTEFRNIIKFKKNILFQKLRFIKII